jgi:hypothetical protein
LQEKVEKLDSNGSLKFTFPAFEWLEHVAILISSPFPVNASDNPHPTLPKEFLPSSSMVNFPRDLVQAKLSELGIGTVVNQHSQVEGRRGCWHLQSNMPLSRNIYHSIPDVWGLGLGLLLLFSDRFQCLHTNHN